MAEQVPIRPGPGGHGGAGSAWLPGAVPAPAPLPEAEPTHAHNPRRESCWLCGMTQAVYQLFPDGGDACADVRWYCQNTRACTERWLAARRAGRRRRALPSRVAAPAAAPGEPAGASPPRQAAAR